MLMWLAVGAGLSSTLLPHPAPTCRSRPALPGDSVVAFVDVSVIPMDRERVLAHQTVLVRGGRIVALGPVRQVPVPAAAARVDGRGKFLIPGLADMHAHLDMTPSLFADTALVAAELFSYVAGGVTTVRDMHSGNAESPLLRLRQQVAAGAPLGPRIYTAGDALGLSVASLAGKIAALKAAGHDFLKVYAPPPPAYDTVMAAAARVGLRVVGHVPDEVAGELPKVLRGWASVEHLTGYLSYMGLPWWGDLTGGHDDSSAAWRQPGYQLDQARLRELAVATQRAGVWNCPTIITYVLLVKGWSAVNPTGASDTIFFNVSGQIVKALQDAGAGLLLGTDMNFDIMLPQIVPGAAVHEELRQLVRAGLTPYQALATGTRNVAAFLGTLDSAGTVAVGKRADLVLLGANPLDDIGHTTALAGVMVSGRWLAPAAVLARLGTWPAALTPKPRESEEIEFYLRKGTRSLWQ